MTHYVDEMSKELIMPVESVITILNALPRTEYLFDFDDRAAIQEYIHGNPTDEQQLRVFHICKAIFESNPDWR